MAFPPQRGAGLVRATLARWREAALAHSLLLSSRLRGANSGLFSSFPTSAPHATALSSAQANIPTAPATKYPRTIASAKINANSRADDYTATAPHHDWNYAAPYPMALGGTPAFGPLFRAVMSRREKNGHDP